MNVCVHRHSHCDAESFLEHEVGHFRSHARQCHQIIVFVRHPTIMFIDELLGCFLDMLSLHVMETDLFYPFIDSGLICLLNHFHGEIMLLNKRF